MSISKQLTERLYELTKDRLKKISDEKALSSRVGMIIQAFRSAINESYLYMWSGIPYYFNGKIYVPIDTDEFKGCVYDVMNMAKMQPADYTQIEKIQRISLQAVKSKPLKLRKDIIVFDNCVLHLGEPIPEDELKKKPSKYKIPVTTPHSPDLAQVTMCHFDYDPWAKCPKWETFLDNVMDNLQSRMVMQECLGCMFLDRTVAKLEHFMILIGNGSNGKGVVSETVRAIVGEDSMTSYGLDSILCGNESLHNIAKMNGKRANWCTEIQAIQAGRFSDKLKAIISGEPIECRQLYGMPFTATEIPLMMANCNALPPMEDKSYGMARRLIIIRFEKTIPVGQQDKMLLKRLRSEYPGIFNWIMEGRQRFIDQHFTFTKSKAIDEAVANYMESANNVEEFCRVNTYSPVPEDAIESQGLHVTAKQFYDEYRRWCISECISPFTIMHFGMAMSHMGFIRTRGCDGTMYKVYGPKALSILSRKKKAELNKQLKEGGEIVNGQELRMGRVYDVGDNSASEQWHISRPYLSLLRKSGYLDGLWKKEPRDARKPGARKPIWKEVVIYDHIKLGQRLEALGVYDCNDGGRSLSERRKDQIRRAVEFNKIMQREGKPFRKLTGKGGRYSPDAIFVDLDWEYTPDNAEAVLDFSARMREREARRNDVKIDKKGNMNTKKKKELLADAIAAKLEGRSMGDDPFDPDTGEVLEIDIEDEDLKITDD